MGLRGNNGGFTKLPKLAARGWLPLLRPSDLLVLVAICDHLPNAYPSTATLARLCGISERAAFAARKRLTELGLIRWSKPCSARRSCKYEVDFNARPSTATTEATFTHPLRNRSSQPRSHNHARDERSFSQSKAKQRESSNKTREQEGGEGVDLTRSPAIDTGTDLPAAGGSEIRAARDALRHYGIKKKTVDLLIARCPWLLPETVHGLVEIVCERDARNPQGLLVKLVREEGARVTRDILAVRTVVSPGSPDDETATATDDAEESPPPSAPNVETPVTDGLRENVRLRDEIRGALDIETDPEKREWLQTRLRELRLNAVNGSDADE